MKSQRNVEGHNFVRKAGEQYKTSMARVILLTLSNKRGHTVIDFLDFFHPPLIYCSYVLVFSKKSHHPCLFQPPRLLIQELLHPLQVYSSLLGY